MMELIIALEPVWVDEHKGDTLKPMVALAHYMRRIAGVLARPDGDYSCKVTLETQMISEDVFREKVMQYMRKRYPEADMSACIRIEPKRANPALDLDSLFDDDDFDVEDESEVLPDPMEKIRALVGGEEFKELAEECVRVAPLIIKHNILDTFTRQCYLFAINDGEGLSTYLELFGELLSYHKLLGYASKMDMVEITLTGKLEDAVTNACTAIKRVKNGGKILSIDISAYMTMLHEPKFRELLEYINEHANKNVVAFRVPFVENNVLTGIKKALSDILSVREVSMVPFDTQELMQCAENELEKRGFSIMDDARDILRSRIVEEKGDGRFYGINTINKVVREMIFMKQLDNARNGVDDTIIKKTEIRGLSETYDVEEKNGLDQLDEYIGMAKIKSRVEEIVFQIEMALKNPGLGSPCIHMRFVGNPGTGKTTVARVIGKILKERGILRKGNFFEHAGRDFCGRFVGETAPKTAAMCRDAYGSVLFIDEAYTLFRKGASGVDYGREAIDTLIAEMENHRNDLVVIMAGYTDEMDTLLQANPGLESRMPYVIEFPSYTRSELCEIFMTMATKTFRVADGVREAVEDYFNNLPEEMLSGKEFSNARYVRNLFERTWGKAGIRSQLNHETEIVIRPEDFLAASAEKEFNKLMVKKTRTLGFV